MLLTYDNEYDTLGTLNKAMSAHFQGDFFFFYLSFKCDTSVSMLNICFPDHVSLEPSVLSFHFFFSLLSLIPLVEFLVNVVKFSWLKYFSKCIHM